MNRCLVFFSILLFGVSLLAERNPIRLTHGPMLGRPASNSIAVWARTSDPGEFLVHYGTDAPRLNQTSHPAKTRIENDNTGSILLTGLIPDTRYHYQIWVNKRPHGQAGTFLTLPHADQTRNAEYNPKGLFNFRFEIEIGRASCRERV